MVDVHSNKNAEVGTGGVLVEGSQGVMVEDMLVGE